MRLLGCIVVAAALLVGAGNTAAGEFPAKPVQIMLGFMPGSSIDTVGRLIAQKLNERWKQPVIIDNRAGAGGNLAAGLVAKAKPDGYTLLLCNNGIAISPAIYSKLSYKATQDLEPVTQVTSMPHVLNANLKLPANSVKELIALAKSKPGQLNFGSAGTGNSDHMAGELFNYLAGINIVHVPYKGGAQAMTDTVNGNVSLYFGGLPVSLPMIKAGRVKPLGTSGTKRSASLPNVPTIAEAGLPGYEVSLWYGLLAPHGTPAEVVAKVAADVSQALKMADVQKQLDNLGVEGVGSTPTEFKGFFRAETEKWGKLVKAVGVSVE